MAQGQVSLIYWLSHLLPGCQRNGKGQGTERERKSEGKARDGEERRGEERRGEERGLGKEKVNLNAIIPLACIPVEQPPAHSKSIQLRQIPSPSLGPGPRAR